MLLLFCVGASFAAVCGDTVSEAAVLMARVEATLAERERTLDARRSSAWELARFQFCGQRPT